MDDTIIKLLFLHFLFIFTTASSSSPSNFTLFGTATINQTTITLTQQLTNCTSPPPYPNLGRIFHKTPIRFLDSSFNSTLSFSTRFSFTIVPPPFPCLSGEGIAFVLTSDVNSLPYSVGSIGLPESIEQNLIESSFLAVEFDTSFDQGLGDINGNHVGVDLDSVFSVASVDLTMLGIDLKSGKRINSWIEYKNSDKVIEIWLGETKIKPESSILVAPVDLSKRFNGFMYVGFSASNGKGSSVHVIDNWQFKTYESDSGSGNIQVEAVGSDNCLICFPERKHKTEIETGLQDNHHQDKTSLNLAIGLMAVNLILILLAVFCVLLYMCLIKKQSMGMGINRIEQTQTQISSFQENNTMPKRLKLSEVRSTTKGFSRNLIINEGVSSIVYRADCNLAVKRFKSGSFGSQFAQEFATMAGCLRHKNLMKLRGWCCERNELILVYDYMPNGSLDKILHDRTTVKLSFESRLNVLLGVSEALVYLHEECERPIIHRNVKGSNVMLDVDFTPKLGDFGMAEVFEHNSRVRDVTVPACAMGYFAPEYVYSGVPTVKTDVYSFGVVVLEVATGRPVVDDKGVTVTDWVWDLWEEKRLVAAADGSLVGKFNRIDMEMMLMVGLICVHPNYQVRPTMKVVLQMLKGEVMPELPEVKPTVMVQSVTSERSPEVVVRCGGGDDGVTTWGTPTSHFSKV